MRWALTIALALGCTDNEAAEKALLDAGYTHVSLTGHSAWSCGRDDYSCTGFTALGPNGRRVTGAVGCGAGCGKGCTIRLE